MKHLSRLQMSATSPFRGCAVVVRRTYDDAARASAHVPSQGVPLLSQQSCPCQQFESPDSCHASAMLVQCRSEAVWLIPTLQVHFVSGRLLIARPISNSLEVLMVLGVGRIVHFQKSLLRDCT